MTRYSAFRSVLDHWVAVQRGRIHPVCFWVALQEWEIGQGYGLWWTQDPDLLD